MAEFPKQYHNERMKSGAESFFDMVARLEAKYGHECEDETENEEKNRIVDDESDGLLIVSDLVVNLAIQVIFPVFGVTYGFPEVSTQAELEKICKSLRGVQAIICDAITFKQLSMSRFVLDRLDSEIRALLLDEQMVHRPVKRRKLVGAIICLGMAAFLYENSEHEAAKCLANIIGAIPSVKMEKICKKEEYLSLSTFNGIEWAVWRVNNLEKIFIDSKKMFDVLSE